MDKARVRVDFADESDIQQLLALNRLGFREPDLLVTPDDYEWRHNQNPAGSAIVPVMRNDAGDIVGCIWIVPLRIRYQGQDLLGATGTHLVIHPNYRDGFTYIMLIRQFERTLLDQQFTVHYSFVAEDHYQRAQRRNPSTVTTIPVLVKILHPRALAAALFPPRWQRTLAQHMGRLMSGTLFRRRSVASAANMRIHVVEPTDDRFDAFWYKIRDKYPLMVARDRAFMAWRFSALAQRGYRLLMAEAGSEVLGYLVQRCAHIRGIEVGLILDFLVCEGSDGEAAALCLIDKAERYFAATKTPVVASLMAPFTLEYQFLKNTGYHRLPSIGSHRKFRLISIFHRDNERTAIPAEARDWFVTIADWEAY